MNEKLAALIALLLTDGGISFTKSKSARISLDSLSEELHKEFTRLMNDLFSAKVGRSGIKSRVGSIKIGNALRKYSPTYRTKKCSDKCTKLCCIECKPIPSKGISYPPVKIPKEIMQSNELIKCVFLKYAFSCDGSASLSIQRYKQRWRFQKKISLACKHPVLLKQWSQILNSIGIHNRISMADDKVYIDSRKGIEEFSKKIKFLENVRLSGKGGSKWKGLKKNEILKLYSYLYQIYDSLGAKRFSGGFWSKNFKSKDEIRKFLINNLKTNFR